MGIEVFDLLTKVRIDEISLVPDGDNPPADIVFYKRRPERGKAGQLYDSLLKAAASLLGREPSEEFAKRAYSEVVEDWQAGTVIEVLERRLEALSQALYEVVFFDDEEGDGGGSVESRVMLSIRQFAEGVEGELPDILAGRIVKMREQYPTPPTMEVFQKSLSAMVAELETPVTAGTTPANAPEVPGMKTYSDILKALDPSDRATVEAELQKIQKDSQAALEALQTQHKELEVKLEKVLDERDPFEKIMDGMSEAQREAFKKERERTANLEKRLDELTAGKARDAFVKTLPVQALPVTSEALADLIFDLPTEKRDKLVEVFKAADSVVRQSALTSPFGDDRSGAAGSAYSEMEALATDLQKADPKLSHERAFAQIVKMRPDLYAKFEAERTGSH